MPIYFITPLNEGQELNYIETHYGDKKSAIKRAKVILRGLAKVFAQGIISVMIEDESLENEYVVTEGDL